MENVPSKPSLQKIIGQGINVNTLNNRGETPLFLACESAQAGAVKLLLEMRADPNITYADGYTSLHCAVHGRCTNETLQDIISHGVYVDSQNIHGETALWLACLYRQQDCVKVLLKAGSNPNITSNERYTSLHAAVNGGYSRTIISKIIDHGADVNVTNKKNVTPLMIACHKRITYAINILLNAGADPNISDAKGNTCIQNAVGKGCSKDALETIVNHRADVNAVNKKHATALMIACASSNKDAINVLLDAGADPNITDGMGNTCIQIAVGNGCSKDVLETIVNHGVDVNATNKKNVTALMIACEKGNANAINVLLNAGAHPNIIDANGNTCLHYAAYGDCIKDSLQTVINHGAEVNATNAGYATAIMLACEKGNTDVINVLLNAGADPSIADADGDTWLHQAVRGGCSKEVLETLISHGADVNAANKNNVTALKIACEKGNSDALNVLLSAGGDPNITDTGGDTCLHHAVRGDSNTVIIETLVRHGADVNATSENNATALMISCNKGTTDVIDVLLHAGPDSNIADDDGYTCLHHAVHGDCSNEILETLINHGACVNATSKNNATALMIACNRGNIDAINVLLRAGAGHNITDDDGDTALHYAVKGHCSKQILETIINHVTDENAKYKKNVAALMKACQKGDIDAINVILRAEADPLTWISRLFTVHPYVYLIHLFYLSIYFVPVLYFLFMIKMMRETNKQNVHRDALDLMLTSLMLMVVYGFIKLLEKIVAKRSLKR